MATDHKRKRDEPHMEVSHRAQEQTGSPNLDNKRPRTALEVSSVQHGGAVIATEAQYGQTQPYKYRPLEEGQIRVLCLQPGAFSYPLHATLEHVDLHGPQSNYEAISYAWEKAELPCKLHVAGTQILHLTESLYIALQHFRRRDQVRHLWADACCIDQANWNERSEQVAVMGKVYGGARRVLVWLGPSQPQDALAF